jgi:hypothetical protein
MEFEGRFMNGNRFVKNICGTDEEELMIFFLFYELVE